jgi:hypothetical protein
MSGDTPMQPESAEIAAKRFAVVSDGLVLPGSAAPRAMLRRGSEPQGEVR